MKCQVPQISWHGRDPVLSIDFQPVQNDVLRLASGGTDSHVLIWYVTCQGNKSIKLECASDLYRHNKAVNVVRFSPKGDILVSGDDDGDMYVWELKEREQMIDPPDDDENINKEDWYPIKSLRAHLDDIYDLSWSKDGNFLVSSSLDNSAVLWDMQKFSKLYTFSDFKGYVQGVSYDPLNQYIASIGIDRMLRVHDINSKKTAYKISKAPWTYSTEKGTFKARLFHDDTLQSFFRRLTFTPDGELLIVPSGIVEKGDEKTSNACYVFSRHALNKPAIKLPTGEKYTVAVKCNPYLYKLRRVHDSSDNENESSKPMIKLPYRMIFAVAASDSVLLYDTEQLSPFAYVSNIHYTHLTDLSWSPDGLTLVVSSTDGYCSFILFTQEELGEKYTPEEIKEIQKEFDKTAKINESAKMDTSEPAITASKTDDDVKQKTPVTTPKRKSPVVESSVPSSGTKEEITPPQKKAKNSNEKNNEKKSSKKSPKMYSIKNFFISPKTAPSNSSSNSASKESSSVIKEKNKDESIEVIDISESPVRVKQVLPCEKCENCVKFGPKEIDENHPAFELVNKVFPGPSAVQKYAKCKIRLEFADTDQLMANADDNASDSNSTFSESVVYNESETKEVLENENDWKLELSQDDDISTKTDPVQCESNPEVSEEVNLPDSSKKSEPSENTVKTDQKDSSESKQKTVSKRRISLITLSSKTSFKK